MSDSLGLAHGADLERLASRLAMLVGPEGEAENAARAAATLAHRLGLTGGHLKAIFLAGAGRLAAAGRDSSAQTERMQQLEAEAAGLRHSIEQLDSAFRRAMVERDEAVADLEALRESNEKAATRRKLERTLAVALVIAGLTGAGVIAYAPAIHLFQPEARLAPTLGRLAVVRPGGATVYGEPDDAAAELARLPEGAPLPIEELVWAGFNQWARTRFGTRPGFVAVSQLQLQ